MKTREFRSDVRSKTNFAWIALAILVAALVLEPLGTLSGSAVSALESDREEPFPEVAGPILASVVLASESDREEPFPEVSGPILASVSLPADLGVRYTAVSAFYVEKLRAQGKPYAAVSAFYVEKLRAKLVRDSLAVDPLLGAVLVDFREADFLASGGSCAVC